MEDGFDGEDRLRFMIASEDIVLATALSRRFPGWKLSRRALGAVDCSRKTFNCGLLSSFPFDLANGTTVALVPMEPRRRRG
ncbi:hypothetical protein ACVWW6_008754 [Bradyrhizobium sp. USDA 3311]|uniref:hypothetical protein n=1 Tax=Bradyrhizobium sp. LCT2 TaxID=2493093 RepID=UPI001373E497|nr:hypothetical protein [Bradyrhizobium sp. LCT2]QHP73054.1 hypothetical protein EI171_40655 [Bradyrhizobium sp. LCT2]